MACDEEARSRRWLWESLMLQLSMFAPPPRARRPLEPAAPAAARRLGAQEQRAAGKPCEAFLLSNDADLAERAHVRAPRCPRGPAAACDVFALRIGGPLLRL